MARLLKAKDKKQVESSKRKITFQTEKQYPRND